MSMSVEWIIYYHTVIRTSFDVYMQGQENMYGGLRTRIYGDLLRGQESTGQQIQELSWRSRFWRLVATCGAQYIKQLLSYRHLINRISRCGWSNSRPNSRTNCCSRPPGRALLLWRISRVCSAGRLPWRFYQGTWTSRLSGRGPSSIHSTLMYITLL